MKTVLVIFGGRSAEHDVSIITAHLPIMEALQATGQFNVMPLYIAKTGEWYTDPAMLLLETFQRPDFAEYVAKLKPVQLLFQNGLNLISPGLRDKQLKIDVAFPAMHGTYGEDGSLMGLLRMAGVPFVGCDLAASAVAMDKILTKQVAGAAGLASVNYDWFWRSEWESDPRPIRQRLSRLKLPVFVKPAHLGSSIGITQVSSAERLEDALEVALHYDDRVIVEEAVEDLTEVTLPIMGNHKPQPALLERPLATFFDFEEKYLKGGKKGESANSQYSELPAKLPVAVEREALRVGLAAYRSLGCSGIARVDMLIDNRTGLVYLNEVNTLPGSLYHHNWRQAGVSAVELMTRLIQLAEERFAEQQQSVLIFDSAILKQVGRGKGQA